MRGGHRVRRPLITGSEAWSPAFIFAGAAPGDIRIEGMSPVFILTTSMILIPVMLTAVTLVDRLPGLTWIVGPPLT